MTVIRLAPNRAIEYRALMLEAYKLHPDAFTSSIAERADLPLGWWAKRIEEDPNATEAVFGAIIEGKLAGVAGLAFETREKTTHKATLFGMYVPYRLRRQGLGRELVHAVFNHARSRPETLVVQLTVTADNAAALRLYESCGFVSYGTEPLAVRVGTRYVSKVHMWCSLRPPNENVA